MKTYLNRRIGLIFFAALFAVTGKAQAGLYVAGHGDLRPYYEGGQLRARYQLDYSALVDGVEVGTFESGPVSFSPGSLVTYIPDVTLTIPDLSEYPAYSFIGANSGDPVWYLPEVLEFDRPWLGLSSEELNFGDWAGDALQLSLASVTGPAGGYFSMFGTGDFGDPIVHMATADGIAGTDIYHYLSGGGLVPGLRVSSHAHVNWMFTQPGAYEVVLKFSGEHVTDGYREVFVPVSFAVAVPEPGGLTLAGVGALALWLARRNRRG
jgi:surface-anchored protein